jgi:hypothetical protein
MEQVTEQTSIVKQITNLSVFKKLMETILVDKSEGSIVVTEVVKDNNIIKQISNKIDFKLKSTRLIVKTNDQELHNVIITDLPSDQTIFTNKPICDCATRNVNTIFSNELENLKNTELHKINYFKQNFFSKIFRRMSNSKLEKEIDRLSEKSSWMIISENLMCEFKKFKLFTENNTEPDKFIHLVGKFGEVNVFVNPNEKKTKIYFGNYDSLTLIANENVSTEKVKCLSQTYPNSVEVKIDFLFIENKPLKCLDIF